VDRCRTRGLRCHRILRHAGRPCWEFVGLVPLRACDDRRPGSRPQWSLSRLAEYPVVTDGSEPEDFFEVAVGPFDRIHVTFGREIRPGTLSNPTRTYRNNIFYTQGTVDT
jgi:hypothetical protein